MKLDCEDGTEAKYWLLTDSHHRNKIVLMINDHLPTVTMMEQKRWWIIPIELKRAIITSGLIAWTHLCPNMQIYPRFKINTRTHHARFKRKKHFICLQSKTDKNIQLTYRKSPNLWNYWSKARSKISPKVQRQSIMQAGAAKIKTENLWLPPLGHGMSVSNFVHRTVRKYSISSLTSTHVKLWKLLRFDLDHYLDNLD